MCSASDDRRPTDPEEPTMTSTTTRITRGTTA